MALPVWTTVLAAGGLTLPTDGATWLVVLDTAPPIACVVFCTAPPTPVVAPPGSGPPGRPPLPVPVAAPLAATSPELPFPSAGPPRGEPVLPGPPRPPPIPRPAPTRPGGAAATDPA